MQRIHQILLAALLTLCLGVLGGGPASASTAGHKMRAAGHSVAKILLLTRKSGCPMWALSTASGSARARRRKSSGVIMVAGVLGGRDVARCRRRGELACMLVV